MRFIIRFNGKLPDAFRPGAISTGSLYNLNHDLVLHSAT